MTLNLESVIDSSDIGQVTVAAVPAIGSYVNFEAQRYQVMKVIRPALVDETGIIYKVRVRLA